ncbi:hypothetical protein KUL156_27740 [Alteromonas sp. KUL156]|nr:hypothetical protein KUL154_49360 [Alteromonas sp. KUL154]GFE00182.1 hypothetical protein KUL156_27740 [Alteromonas sp. KUL156]
MFQDTFDGLANELSPVISGSNYCDERTKFIHYYRLLVLKTEDIITFLSESFSENKYEVNKKHVVETVAAKSNFA